MQVLKRFLYSKDGKTPIEANVGGDIDGIPDELLDGLITEGFIGTPLENKANLIGAPEISPPADAGRKDLADADLIEDLRALYMKATGSEADKRWSVATLREKIIEA